MESVTLKNETSNSKIEFHQRKPHLRPNTYAGKTQALRKPKPKTKYRIAKPENPHPKTNARNPTSQPLSPRAIPVLIHLHQDLLELRLPGV